MAAVRRFAAAWKGTLNVISGQEVHLRCASCRCSRKHSIQRRARAHLVIFGRLVVTCSSKIETTQVPYLATLEMVKCDFWKAVDTHGDDGRSGTDGGISDHIVILPRP